ncbi:hypothetical protein [Candidatus Ichthyocystis sparus]|uniref:hypothetical protein n=2 Tax=Candidatus Ichthyocystis sparus TaxID=1561004 RepID=UPI000AC7266E|nr:hypothetical protein [Candidatus Ichthyocystis sparus]
MYPVSATGGAASSGVPESEDSGDNNKGEEVTVQGDIPGGGLQQVESPAALTATTSTAAAAVGEGVSTKKGRGKAPAKKRGASAASSAPLAPAVGPDVLTALGVTLSPESVQIISNLFFRIGGLARRFYASMAGRQLPSSVSGKLSLTERAIWCGTYREMCEDVFVSMCICEYHAEHRPDLVRALPEVKVLSDSPEPVAVPLACGGGLLDFLLRLDCAVRSRVESIFRSCWNEVSVSLEGEALNGVSCGDFISVLDNAGIPEVALSITVTNSALAREISRGTIKLTESGVITAPDRMPSPSHPEDGSSSDESSSGPIAAGRRTGSDNVSVSAEANIVRAPIWTPPILEGDDVLTYSSSLRPPRLNLPSTVRHHGAEPSSDRSVVRAPVWTPPVLESGDTLTSSTVSVPSYLECTALLGVELHPDSVRLLHELFRNIRRSFMASFPRSVSDHISSTVFSELPAIDRVVWFRTYRELHLSSFMSRCFCVYHSRYRPSFMRSIADIRVLPGSSGSDLMPLSGVSLVDFLSRLDCVVRDLIKAIFSLRWDVEANKASSELGCVSLSNVSYEDLIRLLDVDSVFAPAFSIVRKYMIDESETLVSSSEVTSEGTASGSNIIAHEPLPKRRLRSMKQLGSSSLLEGPDSTSDKSSSSILEDVSVSTVEDTVSGVRVLEESASAPISSPASPAPVPIPSPLSESMVTAVVDILSASVIGGDVHSGVSDSENGGSNKEEEGAVQSSSIPAGDMQQVEAYHTTTVPSEGSESVESSSSSSVDASVSTAEGTASGVMVLEEFASTPISSPASPASPAPVPISESMVAAVDISYAALSAEESTAGALSMGTESSSPLIIVEPIPERLVSQRCVISRSRILESSGRCAEGMGSGIRTFLVASPPRLQFQHELSSQPRPESSLPSVAVSVTISPEGSGSVESSSGSSVDVLVSTEEGISYGDGVLEESALSPAPTSPLSELRVAAVDIFSASVTGAAVYSDVSDGEDGGSKDSLQQVEAPAAATSTAAATTSTAAATVVGKGVSTGGKGKAPAKKRDTAAVVSSSAVTTSTAATTVVGKGVSTGGKGKAPAKKRDTAVVVSSSAAATSTTSTFIGKGVSTKGRGRGKDSAQKCGTSAAVPSSVATLSPDILSSLGVMLSPESIQMITNIFFEVGEFARSLYEMIVKKQFPPRVSNRLSVTGRAIWRSTYNPMCRDFFVSRCFGEYHANHRPGFIRALPRIQVVSDSSDRSSLPLTGDSLLSFLSNLDSAIRSELESIFDSCLGEVSVSLEGESLSAVSCEDFVDVLNIAGTPGAARSVVILGSYVEKKRDIPTHRSQIPTHRPLYVPAIRHMSGGNVPVPTRVWPLVPPIFGYRPDYAPVVSGPTHGWPPVFGYRPGYAPVVAVRHMGGDNVPVPTRVWPLVPPIFGYRPDYAPVVSGRHMGGYNVPVPTHGWPPVFGYRPGYAPVVSGRHMGGYNVPVPTRVWPHVFGYRPGYAPVVPGRHMGGDSVPVPTHVWPSVLPRPDYAPVVAGRGHMGGDSVPIPTHVSTSTVPVSAGRQIGGGNVSVPAQTGTAPVAAKRRRGVGNVPVPTHVDTRTVHAAVWMPPPVNSSELSLLSSVGDSRGGPSSDPIGDSRDGPSSDPIGDSRGGHSSDPIYVEDDTPSSSTVSIPPSVQYADPPYFQYADSLGVELHPDSVILIRDFFFSSFYVSVTRSFSKSIRSYISNAMGSGLSIIGRSIWFTTYRELYLYNFISRCLGTYHCNYRPDFIRGLANVRLLSPSSDLGLQLSGGSLVSFLSRLDHVVRNLISDVFNSRWAAEVDRACSGLEDGSLDDVSYEDLTYVLDTAGVPESALSVYQRRRELVRRRREETPGSSSRITSRGMASGDDIAGRSVLDADVSSSSSSSSSSSESFELVREVESIGEGVVSELDVLLVGESTPVSSSEQPIVIAAEDVDIGVRLAELLNREPPPSPPSAGESSEFMRGDGDGGRKRKRNE